MVQWSSMSSKWCLHDQNGVCFINFVSQIIPLNAFFKTPNNWTHYLAQPFWQYMYWEPLKPILLHTMGRQKCCNHAKFQMDFSGHQLKLSGKFKFGLREEIVLGEEGSHLAHVKGSLWHRVAWLSNPMPKIRLFFINRTDPIIDNYHSMVTTIVQWSLTTSNFYTTKYPLPWSVMS